MIEFVRAGRPEASVSACASKKIRLASSSSISNSSASCRAPCLNSSLIVYSSPKTSNFPTDFLVSWHTSYAGGFIPVPKLCRLCSFRGFLSNRFLKSLIWASISTPNRSILDNRFSERARRSVYRACRLSKLLSSAIVEFDAPARAAGECWRLDQHKTASGPRGRTCVLPGIVLTQRVLWRSSCRL